MKHFLFKAFTIFFPWLTLLILDNPGGAIVALIMQATLIGWIPASFWALKELRLHEEAEERRKKQESMQK